MAPWTDRSILMDCLSRPERKAYPERARVPNGIAEVPLTIRISGPGTWLFSPRGEPDRASEDAQTVWHVTLRRAKVADGWVTQLLRQGDVKVFKMYSQMKREAPRKLNRTANEDRPGFDKERTN